MIIGQSDTDYSRRILVNDTALIRICGQCAVRRRSAESSARRLRRVGITADPHLTRTPLPATAATHSLSLISNVYHSSRCRNRNEAKRSFRSGGVTLPADGGDTSIRQYLADTRRDIALDQSNVLAVQPRFSFRYLPICIVYTSIREGGGAALQTGHPARPVAQTARIMPQCGP